MTESSTKHSKRIRDELIKAGMTTYGLIKAESRHLPQLIHADEHIGGVVYGRAEKGSAMLVATDKRVLYLDHKIMFNRSDELTYDIVSGVSSNIQPGYAGIVLHTRLGDFEFKFVNLKCARRFVRYVEQMRIELPKDAPDVAIPEFMVESGHKKISLSQKAKVFLMSHELAVLSTVDSSGFPHGSAVYYAADKQNNIFMVTRSKTKKAINIGNESKVALTIYDTNSMQTLQATGYATSVSDPVICKQAYERILRPRFEGSHAELPPVLYMSGGEYEVIMFIFAEYAFTDYKQRSSLQN